MDEKAEEILGVDDLAEGVEHVILELRTRTLGSGRLALAIDELGLLSLEYPEIPSYSG